jgi:hypothetical protein
MQIPLFAIADIASVGCSGPVWIKREYHHSRKATPYDAAGPPLGRAAEFKRFGMPNKHRAGFAAPA